MALTNWQEAEIKVAADKYLGNRNKMIAAHTDELSVNYRIEGQSVYIFEHRKTWRGNEFQDIDVAKATYVCTTKKWKLFWMMRDLKWHSYIAEPEHEDIESVFRCVNEDAACAFLGKL